MCTTLNGVDVVHIRVYVFVVVRIIHNGNLDRNALLFGFQVDNIVKKVRTVAVYIFHKLFQSVFSVENFLSCLPFLIWTQVGECDFYTCIQERKFSHTACHNVPLEHCCCENAGIWPELLTRTRLVGIANYLHRIERFALFVFLLVDFSVTEHLRHHVGRQCINTADTHTVQTTADLVGTLIELTTRVQYGHNHLERTLVQLLMFVYWDTTSVVLNGNGVVVVYGYFDMAAIACHSLVDRVVYCLVDEVVKSFFAYVANIHRRAFAHCFKSFEDLNITGRVVVLVS